jgi:hypothetical protein
MLLVHSCRTHFDRQVYLVYIDQLAEITGFWQ